MWTVGQPKTHWSPVLHLLEELLDDGCHSEIGYPARVANGKPARITAFSREQGFGRVAVPDEGELVFDAAVLLCLAKDVVAGAEVRVETAPGRMPGARKVTKLWLADAAPLVDPSSTPDGAERFVSFGPYQLLLPPFWPEAPVNASGRVWSSSAKLNGVLCVLLVFVGGAGDVKAKADLIAARAAGAPTTRCDTVATGVPFEGYRFDHGAEVELLYVLEAHGDLLTAGCRCAATNHAAEGLSVLLLTMIGAAVHRRGPPAAVAPAPAMESGGGWWRRLFKD